MPYPVSYTHLSRPRVWWCGGVCWLDKTERTGDSYRVSGSFFMQKALNNKYSCLLYTSGRGNYALGIKEQLIFPEVEYDKVDKVRGMDIIFVTTAKTDEEARELLTQFNMPFAK